MNFLRICRYLYSKRLFGEIILLLQLIFMIELSFVVLNPIDSFIQKKMKLETVYTAEFDNLLHFSKNNLFYAQEMLGNGTSAESIYNILSEKDDIKQIIRFGFDNGLYEYTNQTSSKSHTSNANLVVYSDEMMEKIKLKIQDGKMEQYSNENGYFPILVSCSLASEIPIGTETEIEFSSNKTKIKCKVVGILKADCAIPVVMNYGYLPELENLAVFCNNSSSSKYIIFYSGVDDLLYDVMEANFLIEPVDGVSGDKLADSLQEQLSNYGTFSVIDNMISKAFVRLMEDNSWYVLVFLVLTLISVFGYGGYLYLMIRQNTEEFAIFYILGITRKKMTGIIFFSGAALLVLAFGIATLIYPWFITEILKTEQSGAGFFSYGFSFSLFLLILCLSIFSGFGKIKKQTEVGILNGGE